MPKTKAPTAAANIYAVVGSDEAEVKRVAVELAQKLTPRDAGDFGLELIDGAADNAEQAAARIRSTIEALQTLPFFGNTKVVWLKNANFLGDNAIGRAASVQSVLEELSDLLESGLGSELTFLVSATEVDKRRGFYKTLVKRAEIQVFDRLDSGRSDWEEEATEIVRRRAKKRKLQFDEDALDLFVLLTGGDTRQIENELEKIDIFMGKDRAVHVDLVREIVPLSRAGVIFELSNALAIRDLELALTLVRRLLDRGHTSLPRSESPTRYHAARSRTHFNRSRGEIAWRKQCGRDLSVPIVAALRPIPHFQTAPPSNCLRAIGPMYGISQRTPVNAFTMVMIMITKNTR